MLHKERDDSTGKSRNVKSAVSDRMWCRSLGDTNMNRSKTLHCTYRVVFCVQNLKLVPHVL